MQTLSLLSCESCQNSKLCDDREKYFRIPKSVSKILCYLVEADEFLCTVLAKKLHKYADQI